MTQIGIRIPRYVRYREYSWGGLLLLAALHCLLPVAMAETTIGVWNGFLDHRLVAECHSTSVTTRRNLFTIHSSDGSERASFVFEIDSFATRHFILTDFPLDNQYGVYRITEADGKGEPEIVCHTMTYRFANDTLQYAHSILAEPELSGASAGIANTIDPSGAGIAVQNWLSVYEPTGTRSLTFKVLTFNADGASDAVEEHTIAPSGRVDISISNRSNQNGNQNVVSFLIAPNDAQQPYGAFVTRYGMRVDGEYRFAFAYPARQGGCHGALLPVSTFGTATNWLEVLNAGEQSAHLRWQLANSNRELLAEGSMVLPSKAQRHIQLSEILGSDRTGVVSIACEGQAAVIAQNILYGATREQFPSWAYASAQPLDRTKRVPSITSLNTFLSAANWSRFVVPPARTAAIRSELYAAAGRDAETAAVVPIFRAAIATIGIDYDLHSLLGTERVGLLSTISPTEDFYTDALRVYHDTQGTLRYVTNVVTLPVTD